MAFEVQKPVLEKWGFEAAPTAPCAMSACSKLDLAFKGNEHGVREMTAAIREHAGRTGKDEVKSKSAAQCSIRLPLSC